MNLAPDLDTPVIVTAEAHEHAGKTGRVTGYHGRLPDMVYVVFHDDPGREHLLSLAYLSEAQT